MSNAVEILKSIPGRNADKIFSIDAKSGVSLTYGEFHAWACAIANDFHRRGINREDRVAIILDNSPQLALLYFGCLYAGIVIVPINPNSSEQEVELIARSSQPRLLVVSPSTSDKIRSNRLNCEVLTIDDGSTSSAPEPLWRIESLENAPHYIPFEHARPENLAVILYTSGTTATPRGVQHSIGNLVGNAQLFINRLGIHEDHRFFVSFAMTYTAGFYNLLILPFIAGASIVIARAFDALAALNFWKPAQLHSVNVLWLPPTALSLIMELDRSGVGEAFCRNQVELALIATAPLPSTLRHKFQDRFGIQLYESYGLSEVLFVATNDPINPVETGCVGRVLDGLVVDVVDDNDQPVVHGKEGEIRVLTPHVMNGYFNDVNEEPDEIFSSHPYYTGDMGILSDSGELKITGRKKDLIIRGGVNISSASIEEVFYLHPAIAECAVVGIPHTLYGEEPAAVVRLSPGYVFETIYPQLLDSCKENFNTAKRPKHIVEMDEFPRSSNGKARKYAIREELIKLLELG